MKKAKHFGHLVALGLDPTAFLKGPEGCPLDHRSVQIRAFQPESDLLSTHIGSWPKVKLADMTKKRVLQRVLRYYGGSTLPRWAATEYSTYPVKEHTKLCDTNLFQVFPRPLLVFTTRKEPRSHFSFYPLNLMPTICLNSILI